MRGYHFLRKIEDLDARLMRWKDLPPEERREIAGWLLGLCRNGKAELPECMRELGIQESAGDVLPFYRAHAEDGRKMYDSYFNLVEGRTDITWFHEDSLEGPIVPFTKPSREATAQLAKNLIEAAWKGDGWQLRLG